jgi:hypothetical protein
MDKPIQLVYPDPSHTALLLNEQSLQILSTISQDLAVIGVVGPYHSGKSFLMNQLMDKATGFKLGPLVTPETTVSSL